jgi:hypothetical protein
VHSRTRGPLIRKQSDSSKGKRLIRAGYWTTEEVCVRGTALRNWGFAQRRGVGELVYVRRNGTYTPWG